MKKSNLIKHAEEELKRAGLFDADSDYAGMLGDSVLELIEVFARQGHSGMSAPMVVSLFKELASYNNITPLTGEESEWENIEPMLKQNKRNSAVFEDKKGSYFVNAIIFVDPDNNRFIGKAKTKDGRTISSLQYFEFPFLPKTFYINVDKNKMIIDEKQLDEVFKVYKGDTDGKNIKG
jgi:hypothetical protein